MRGGLREPFEGSDCWVDKIVPGHVQRRHSQIARYRCKACGKLTAAAVPERVAPSKSRFWWGTHFRMAGWHPFGLPHSRIRMLRESEYGQKTSVGEIDKMLARANRLFAPAVEAIQRAIREGMAAVVDNARGRGDRGNHCLWDFGNLQIEAIASTPGAYAADQIDIGCRREEAGVTTISARMS